MFQTVALLLDSEFLFTFFYSNRLLLTTVHFNENGSREQALTKINELIYKITFLIQKNGRHYSQENKISKRTYGIYIFLSRTCQNKAWVLI